MKTAVKYLLIVIVPVSFFIVWILFFASSENTNKRKGLLSKKEKESIQQGITAPAKENSFQKYPVLKKKVNSKRSSLKKQKSIIQVLLRDELKTLITDSVRTPMIPKDTIESSTEPKIIFNKEPLVMKEIPNQIINQGENFSFIDLKSFILNSNNNLEGIKWVISENKNLKFTISKENLLITEVPNEDWYGVDTVIITGYNYSGQSSSAKIIFEVKEAELINRYPVKPVKDLILTGVEDALSLISNPLQWGTDDIINASTIIIGTVLLSSIDEKVKESVTRYDNYEHNTLMNFGKFFGETSTSQCAALGITLCGIALSDKNISRLGLEVFESYLIADRITFLLKYTFGRDRPSAQNGNMYFKPFSGRSNVLNALPSGHATLAFSLSTVLSSCTDNFYLKVLIYSPAFITAISRVYQNYHWTSDVFLGGAIGYVVGSFLVNRHNKIFSEKISLGFDQEGRIGIIYRF
jgi:hypothetical protein